MYFFLNIQLNLQLDLIYRILLATFNSYIIFNTKKFKLANYFKESPINFTNPFSTNNL